MADVLDDLLSTQPQHAASAPATAAAPSAPSGDVLDQLLGSQAPAPKSAATAPTPTPATPEHIENLQWSDVPGQAVSHLGTSAYGLASNIGHALIHPIQTAETLGDVGMGVLEKMGIKGGDEHIPMANAVGKMFADRYGGMDNLKQTIATDPLGFAMDASALLGGSGALLRGAGMAGAADVASTAARLTSPLTPIAKGAQLAGKGAAQVVGSLTHAGPRPLETAAEAGFEGGTGARAFRENIAGRAPMEAPVEEARAGIGSLEARAGQQYRDDMAKLGQNPQPLKFDDIDKAIADATQQSFLHGKSTTPTAQFFIQQGMSPAAAKAAANSAQAGKADVLKRINNQVQYWKSLSPAEHDATGFDILKKEIGDIRQSYPIGSPENTLAGKIYNATKQTIVDQDKNYADYMSRYQGYKDIINELRKTFSLPLNQRAASQETALKKLQGMMRDQVNTGFGYKMQLGRLLQEEAPDLLPKLAGQSLQSWTPHGLGKLTLNASLEALAMLGGIGGGAGLTGGALAGAALLPFMSPHLMGNVAYGLGRAARAGSYSPYIFQAGRAAGAAEDQQP